MDFKNPVLVEIILEKFPEFLFFFTQCLALRVLCVNMAKMLIEGLL